MLDVPYSLIVIGFVDDKLRNRNNAQNYIKPPVATTIFLPILGTHNLLIAEGNEHERARRMINPAFYHDNLKSMISIIIDRTAKTIESIFLALNSNQEKQFDLIHLHYQPLYQVHFGSDLETNANAKDVMSRVLNEVSNAVVFRMINQIPFLARLPFWKKDIVDNGTQIIAKFVDEIIIDRRQGRSTTVDNEGQPFTDQEIKEQALTFVLAGSETTGNLMVWIFYLPMTHDDVFQACREEIDKILPNGIEPSNEHLTDLVICEAIINETLRLYPPAPFFVRYCIHEHTIGQLHIPIGTSITVNTYTLYRRSDLWSRPLEFDYTRWIRDPKTGLKPKLPHPFAAGPRNCIGQNFALLEAKLMLVQQCNFKLIPGQKIVPDVQVTLRTKYGLLANISKRQIF